MKAVVLAAGRGKRLGKLKPLVKVAGREILYRNLYILSELGIEEFIVVVADSRIEEFLTKHEFNCRIVWNHMPERVMVTLSFLQGIMSMVISFL
jgi:CDP-L-myo-inositol myo-inositolphosphotransferase